MCKNKTSEISRKKTHLHLFIYCGCWIFLLDLSDLMITEQNHWCSPDQTWNIEHFKSWDQCVWMNPLICCPLTSDVWRSRPSEGSRGRISPVRSGAGRHYLRALTVSSSSRTSGRTPGDEEDEDDSSLFSWTGASVVKESESVTPLPEPEPLLSSSDTETQISRTFKHDLNINTAVDAWRGSEASSNRPAPRQAWTEHETHCSPGRRGRSRRTRSSACCSSRAEPWSAVGQQRPVGTHPGRSRSARPSGAQGRIWAEPINRIYCLHLIHILSCDLTMIRGLNVLSH